MDKNEVMNDIIKTLKDRGAKDEQLPRGEIEKKLDILVQYNVAPDSAKRTIINQYLRDLGLARRGGSSELLTVKDIDHKGQFLSIKVKVTSIFENNHPSVFESGMCGDPTGMVKFVVFQKNAELEGLPLKEGGVYLLESVVADEYQGRYSLKLNKNTAITELDEDFEVKENIAEMTGIVVDIQNGSGIVRRCSVCDKVVTKGMCPDDGKVETKPDLRVKAVLDDGRTAQNLILNAELTAQVTGIDMRKATKIAMDAVGDNTAVVAALSEVLLGKYWKVSGPVVGRNLLVRSMTPVTAEADPARVVEKLGAL